MSGVGMAGKSKRNEDASGIVNPLERNDAMQDRQMMFRCVNDDSESPGKLRMIGGRSVDSRVEWQK